MSRHLKFRGAFVVAFAGLASTMWACSDDTSVVPVNDAGPDSSVADSSTNDARMNDATGDARDATTVDTGAGDAVREATIDATANDAPVEARVNDSGPGDAANDAPDSTLGDAASDAPSEATSDAADARAEAEGPDAAPPSPVQWCPMLDTDYGVTTTSACPTTTSTTTCGSDRFNNWVPSIVMAYAAGPVSTDCRIDGMFAALTTQDKTDYANDLLTWTLTVLGCAEVPAQDAGPYAFGLIPRALAGSWQFTTADLKLLSDFYVQSIDDAIAADATSPTALTTQQKADLSAWLAYLASQVPGTQVSPSYSFGPCTDGGDAATDGPGGG